MSCPNGTDAAFRGWRTYPENMAAIGKQRFAYDLQKYNERLCAASPQLFVTDEKETLLQVTEIGSQPQRLDGSPALENYLQQSRNFQGCRVIFVPQLSSVGQLLVSEPAFRKLATSLKASPGILDVVHAFGKKAGDEERTGISIAEHTEGQRHESCWLFKHVEKHEREEQPDPWSIRQMGVYLSKNPESTTFVVFNPSKRFQERLKSATNEGEVSVFDILVLLVSCSSQNWRQYLDYLETRLDTVNRKINHTVNFDVEFTDMLEVQNIRHKLCVARTALCKDKEVVSILKGDVIPKEGSTQRNPGGTTQIAEQFERELGSQVLRSDNLLIRLDGAASLVGSILDFHAKSAMQTSNQRSQRLAELAQIDNDLMVDLTKKSAADARTLKTITILTLIYLPASFVSTLLGMDYIKITETHPVTLQFRAELYIFGILTILLLLITLGFWAVSEWRQRTKITPSRISRKVWA